MTSEGNSALFSGELRQSTAIACDFSCCITTSHKGPFRATPEKFKNATIYRGQDRLLATIRRFQKAMFSQRFPSTQKRFQIPPVRRALSKTVWTVGLTIKISCVSKFLQRIGDGASMFFLDPIELTYRVFQSQDKQFYKTATSSFFRVFEKYLDNIPE